MFTEKEAMFRLITSLLLVTGSVLGQTQPQRAVGPVQCLLDSSTNFLTAKFVTLLNGDDINFVYGCKLDNTGNACSYSGCQFQTFDVNVGGVTKTYLSVESAVDVSVADPENDGNNQNACGFTTVTNINNQKGYKWRIGLRKQEGFLWSVDNDYIFTCYESQALQLVLTNVITVTHDNLIVNQPINNPTVNMYVLGQTAQGTYARTSSCVVGQNMKLEIEMTQTQYADYLLPWGLYSMNTRVAPDATMALADALTDNNGCRQNPNVLELMSGFVRDGSASSQTGTTVTSNYKSGVFQCKQYLFSGSNQLHFDTRVQFCIGTYGTDNKCIDFCTFQTPNGRRRRDVTDANENLEYDVTAVVTVRELESNEEKSEESKGICNGNCSLIIAISVACFVVVLAIVLALVVLFYVGRRRQRERNVSDTDSRASSDRKLPVF